MSVQEVVVGRADGLFAVLITPSIKALSFNTLRKLCHVWCYGPRSGELRTQKLKSHLVRTQSLNVLPLKPGVGQYIAEHVTLTAMDFFLAYFEPSGPFTCIFFHYLSRFFLWWLWLTHGSWVGPQNKIGHPAGCRLSCSVSAEYKQAKKTWLVVLWLVKWITWR